MLRPDVSQDKPGRHGVVEARLAHPKANLIPKRAQGEPDQLVDLFERMLVGQSAQVVRLSDFGEIPGAVCEFLREHNIAQKIVHGADALWDEMSWEQVPALERRIGPAKVDDLSSLSYALAGAAETGTLFLTSGQDNPTTLNFLPENHIVVVRQSNIAGSYEQAFDALRELYGPGNMPRAVNLISGPSRTAEY